MQASQKKKPNKQQSQKQRGRQIGAGNWETPLERPVRLSVCVFGGWGLGEDCEYRCMYLCAQNQMSMWYHWKAILLMT